MSETEKPRHFGKWSEPGIPHRGWTCLDVKDLCELGEDFIVCEMCEMQTIRFVHKMIHPNYPETLDCGSNCAGKLEQDSKSAADRDKAVRSRATRRQKFPDRKGWKVLPSGDIYIVVNGYRCTVKSHHDGHGILIQAPEPYGISRGIKRYASEREAKAACFDALAFIKERVSKTI